MYRSPWPVLTTLLLLTFGLSPFQPLKAQGGPVADVPANHWSYQAITDLANKGYVTGYPDGSFLGDRTLTRFEFANIIDRIVQSVNSLEAASTKSASPLLTSTSVPVTEEDLNRIQALTDSFKPELVTIHSQIDTINDELNALRDDVLLGRHIAQTALKTAKLAKQTADDSFGNGTTRKFSITGYIQSRYEGVASSNHNTFPQGYNSSANAGGIAAAYNGTYAQGGTSSSEEIRRARFYIEGSPTQNTSYQVQFDASGAVNNYATANSQVIVLQAFGTYKFGNGTAKYPALAAGLLLNPFGYAVGVYPAAMITPERPLAFNLTNNVGLWDSQDTDKGLSLSYGPKQVKFTYALINGSGRQSENIQNHFDSVAHVEYTSPTKLFNIGASYYGGVVARGRSTGDDDATITTNTYPEPKKELYGVDAQANDQGFFADYEWVRGTYEKRSYFDSGLVTPLSNPLGFQTDNYVKGNQVQGSYVWGGYTFNRSTPRPLTFAFDYDTFQRSISSQSNSENALQSNVAAGYSPQYLSSGSTWDDVNAGYGALYNLDASTRLRLWFEKPFAIAHAPGTMEPPKIGLYTAEMQVRF